MFQKMPIDEDEAIRLYESGMSLKEVGERLGCSYMTVRSRLKNRGIVIRNRRARIPPSVEREICALYDQGLTNEQIASKFGICPPTVTKIARRGGCTLRGKNSNIEAKRRAARKGRESQTKASHEKMRQYISESSGGLLEAVENVQDRTWTLRCTECGQEFTRYVKYGYVFSCPNCNPPSNTRLSDEEREFRRLCKEQQRMAAREWRLSVPRVCKECGEPFYSEYQTAAYCSDGCRKRANNRKNEERKKRNGRRACGYRHRMRIEKTPETYDPSVTLDALYKRKHGKCAMCGCKTIRTGKYHQRMATLDHIVALGNNGTHTWDNVQLLCSECNSKKRDLGQMRLAI